MDLEHLSSPSELKEIGATSAGEQPQWCRVPLGTARDRELAQFLALRAGGGLTPQGQAARERVRMLAADGFARDEKNVVKAIRLRSLTAAAQDSVSLYSAAAPIPGGGPPVRPGAAARG